MQNTPLFGRLVSKRIENIERRFGYYILPGRIVKKKIWAPCRGNAPPFPENFGRKGGLRGRVLIVEGRMSPAICGRDQSCR